MSDVKKEKAISDLKFVLSFLDADSDTAKSYKMAIETLEAPDLNDIYKEIKEEYYYWLRQDGSGYVYALHYALAYSKCLSIIEKYLKKENE